MNLKTAYKTLRRFQDWRTGMDCRDRLHAGIEGKEITEAIDLILKNNGCSKPLINCKKCKHTMDEPYWGTVMGCRKKECKFEVKK